MAEFTRTQIDYDNARTDKLSEYGYKVLRFSNKEVINDLPKVLTEIERVATLLQIS